MEIFIEEPNRTSQTELFIGKKRRMSTMTSVYFTDDNHLVTAHYSAAKMFSVNINLEEKTHEFKSEVDTTFDSKLTVTDLIDFDGKSKVVTSNFDACGGSLYGLEGKKLRHIKDFALPEDGGNCHGARFYDSNTICLSTNKKLLFFIDIESSKVLAKVPTPYFMKDICFINANSVLAPFAVRSPSKQLKSTYSSGLVYASIDLENAQCKVIDKLFFTPSAFDAICFQRDREMFYITDQGRDRVIVAKINSNKIHLEGEYKGFDFPHGIDVKGNIIAYTNYGNSMIGFKDINSEKLHPISGRVAKWRPLNKQDLKDFKHLFRYYFRRVLRLLHLRKR